MRSMRSAVVGPWACFRLMTVFIKLRLVPFQLFAPNSLLGHPTANRRLFGPNLSPDQVGTALAQCVDTCVAGQSGSDSYPITNYSLAQILAPIIAGRRPKNRIRDAGDLRHLAD